MMIFFRRVLEASIYLRYVRHHRSSSSSVCGGDFPGQRELLADNAKTFHTIFIMENRPHDYRYPET
jgi:hypothetical protein